MNSDDSQDEHDPKFRVSNTEFGDMSILEHIGVRPSSVLLANCTIWVEGITDRLYFSKYVELTLKQRGVRLIENLHYSFVEYGGANITHWSFLDEEGINVERLCARLMLIADEDKGKLERHDKLEANLGDRYIKLPVREVENLLTPNVIQEIIYDYEGDEISVHPFNSIDYATELLGRFIDEKVLVDKTKSKRFGKRATCYADTSGTVKDKLPFCKKALSHIDGLKSLSAEAKRIANEICTFIERQNGIHRRSETNR